MIWIWIWRCGCMYTHVSAWAMFYMHPCWNPGCCEKWQPLTSLLRVSPEIHHVTSWSTCSADILPEMPFRYDSSGLDTIVCLLHNLSAGMMWSLFFFPCCFQLCAHNWGCLSSRINVSVADFTVDCERRDSGLQWICMLFELGHVQMGKKKIDARCLVHSHWFREVMKTHCFYFTGHCCKLPHLWFV